jgi:hypothetical protein
MLPLRISNATRILAESQDVGPDAGDAMTRKPQIAWGLRIKTSGEDFIVLWTIRRTRKDAEETFWQEYEYYGPQARTNIEQRFKDGTYRFVKVQIIPVEGEDD